MSLKKILAGIIFFLCLGNLFAQTDTLIDINSYLKINSQFTDVFFLNENHGWIAGSKGLILKTTDGGVNWEKINYTSNLNFNKVMFVDTANGWISSGEALYFSEDGGRTWSEKVGVFRSKSFWFISPNVGYATSQDDVFKTTDGAKTWEIFRYGPGVIADFNDIKANKSMVFAAGEWGMVMQNSNLPNGTGFQSGIVMSNLNSIQILKNDLIWIVGDQGKIVKAKNFLDYTEKPSGTLGNLNSVYFPNENIGWIAGNAGIILKTENGGENWKRIKVNSSVNLRSVNALSTENVWIVGSDKIYTNHLGVFETDVIKDTSVLITDSIAFQIKSKAIPEAKYSLINSPEGAQIDSLTGIIKWQANLSGKNKIVVKTYNEFGSKTDTVTVNVNKPVEFYNTQNDTTIALGDSLNISINANGFPAPKYYLTKSPQNMNIDSASGIINWKAGTSGTFEIIVSAKNDLNEISDSFYVLVFDKQIFVEEIKDTSINIDDSIKIVLKANGYPELKIKLLKHPATLQFDSLINTIFWKADEAGEHEIIWTAENSFVQNTDTFFVKVSKKEIIPDEYKLEQNFPNPFNPKTTIRYSIPENVFVEIKIFDLLGNHVATLVNENKQAGNHFVQFGGNNLSSGIYFYTIKAGNFTQTKKLIILK